MRGVSSLAGLLSAVLVLASCATPPDDPFRSAYQPGMTAGSVGDVLRQRLLERFPPGRADLYTAERYLAQAGAKCGPTDDGAQRCTYALLRPRGGQGAGPLDSQGFIYFDVDLIPDGGRVKDIRVLVN